MHRDRSGLCRQCFVVVKRSMNDVLKLDLVLQATTARTTPSASRAFCGCVAQSRRRGVRPPGSAAPHSPRRCQLSLGLPLPRRSHALSGCSCGSESAPSCWLLPYMRHVTHDHLHQSHSRSPWLLQCCRSQRHSAYISAGLEAAGSTEAADKGVDTGQGAGGSLRGRACGDGGWRASPSVSTYCHL